ncbi:Threonyl/alanyl tRNA synthetase, partial [Hyaloraphidium curvatum]
APLGRLACQRDSLRRTLSTIVASCEPDGSGRWRISLDDTVIFPTGGGQPNDLGTIAAADGSASAAVLDSLRLRGRAVHVCDAPLDPGTRVEASVDWPRRTDHMQQHSSQHLLSAIAWRQFGWETVGWTLSPRGRCVVEFASSPGKQAPDAAGLAELERLANAAILDARPVIVEEAVTDPALFRSREGAPSDDAKQPAADEEKGELRYVRIEGHDINPCCGTHVPNLSMLQLVKIVGHEGSARAAKGGKEKTANARVFFVAGNRALEHYSSLVDLTRELAAMTKGTVEGLPDAFRRLMDAQRAATKELA